MLDMIIFQFLLTPPTVLSHTYIRTRIHTISPLSFLFLVFPPLSVTPDAMIMLYYRI